MPTSTSLNLQALLKTAAARTGMDSSASHVRGLSPSAQALYVAVQASHRKSAVRVVVVPTDEDVDRFCIDTRFFMAALEGASAAALEEAVKPFPVAADRSVSKPRAAFRRRVGARGGAARDRERDGQGCGGICRGALDPAERARQSRGCRHRAEERDGSRSRRAGRSARRRRLHARGSGRRARRVLRPRRHRRLFSGRRRQSDPRRVRRRDGRVDPPVRSIDAALDRDTRSGRRCSADRESQARRPSSTTCPAIAICPSSSSKKRRRPRRPTSSSSRRTRASRRRKPKTRPRRRRTSC